MSAYGPGRAPAKPPTIYRSLDFLAVLGLVHRIESLNAFVACGGQHQSHSAQFLICDCCGRIDELDLGSSDAVAAAAAHQGFQIDRVVLEAHGRCRDCR